MALLGARLHFAVPRLLQRFGMLERLFTDFSPLHGWARLLHLFPLAGRSEGVRRLLARVPHGVPPDRITAFNWLGLAYAWRRRSARSAAELTRIFLWANQSFCERVCASDWGKAEAVFTFSGAGLEILQRAKREGRMTVLEQTIAPTLVEQRLLQEERALRPGWEEAQEDHRGAEYSQREQAEWPLADRILCGSEFVRQGIGECGGPVEKCVVVPYGVELPKAAQSEDGSQSSEVRGQTSDLRSPISDLRPLRVLTVGTVCLRKGAPYVLEAAKRLKGRAEFRIIGPIQVLPAAEKQLRERLDLVGPLPHDETAQQFDWADIFLLPSLCEGSATVTYEALRAGLPVICTPNTGSVVRDGLDGHLVPIRDVDAIVERLTRLAQDGALLTRMRTSARERAKEFDLDSYAKRLLAACCQGSEARGQISEV